MDETHTFGQPNRKIARKNGLLEKVVLFKVVLS